MPAAKGRLCYTHSHPHGHAHMQPLAQRRIAVPLDIGGGRGDQEWRLPYIESVQLGDGPAKACGLGAKKQGGRQIHPRHRVRHCLAIFARGQATRILHAEDCAEHAASEDTYDDPKQMSWPVRGRIGLPKRWQLTLGQADERCGQRSWGWCRQRRWGRRWQRRCWRWRGRRRCGRGQGRHGR